MKLTPQQFRDHVKEHGKTEAVNTERYYHVPENTKLYFWLDDGHKYLSTWNKYTENKNKLYNYDFDHEWLWKEYTWDFIIEDTPREYKVGDVLIGRYGIKRTIDSIEPAYKLTDFYWAYSKGTLESIWYSLYTPELIEVDGKKYLKEDILKLTPQ